MASLECYFDESGSHDRSPVLCVAGYMFESESRKRLDLAWKEVLDRYRLPVFRMTACAHNNYPFDGLSRDECIEVEKEVIKLINEHALLGLAIAVNEHDYNVLFTRPDVTGDAYSFFCRQILAGVQSWIRRNDFEGDISYFFEAGHASQTRANAIMNRLFKDRRLRKSYHYASHDFVDKKIIRPGQAADILAWQQATQMKRWLKSDSRIRADFRALMVKPRHELFIANRKNLASIIAYQRYLQHHSVSDGVTGSFGSTWFWCPFDGNRHEHPRRR
jgi:hypothetical protein